MIHYYDENAQTFFNDTENLDRSMHYEDFLSLIPIGGKILDASCTAGQDSVIFMNRGYEVVAMDGAIEMCKLAGEYMGEEVDHMQFQEVDFAPIFDGIWAAASLMHVPSYEIQRVLKKLKKGLSPNGILYASFKYSDFEGQRNGRYFLDLTPKKAHPIFTQSGFDTLKMWSTEEPHQTNFPEKWLNILAKPN